MIRKLRHSSTLEDGRILPLYTLLDRAVAPGEYSISGLQKNEAGELIQLNYAKVISLHVKPLSKFLFVPEGDNRLALIVGLLGSDVRVTYDQSWSTSQLPHWMAKEKGREHTDLFVRNAGNETLPEKLVEYCEAKNCRDILFTYCEPVVNLDYIMDVATEASKRDIKIHLISNGFMTDLVRGLIAQSKSNIVFKIPSMENEFYIKHCKSKVDPVKANLEWFYKNSCQVQVETILIPGENTSPRQIENIANFIRSIDGGIPWTLQRFYPAYRILDKNLTTNRLLESAKVTGHQAGLKNIQIISGR